MSETAWFNPSFAQAVDDDLLQSVRTSTGCCFCNAEGGTRLVCSRCRIACYCSKDCQRADWKKAHKIGCAVTCENRDHPANFSFGEVLKGGHLIDVDLLETYMSDRREAFFKHVRETHSLSGAEGGESTTDQKRAVLHLACSAVWQFQKAWIAGEVSLWGGDGVQTVNHILFVPIDSGERARSGLQDSARPGRLSKAALRKARDALVAYAKQVHESNAEMGGITFGNGLLDQVGDTQLMERIRATGCKVMYDPVAATNHM